MGHQESPKGLNSEKCPKKLKHLCLISVEEVRGPGGIGKEWVVLTRKLFWIVACRINFRGARLCIKTNDRVEHQSRYESLSNADRNTQKTNIQLHKMVYRLESVPK